MSDKPEQQEETKEKKHGRLTRTAIDNLKTTGKLYKVTDHGHAGLLLVVMANGSKLWRMQYRFQGKQQTISFGAYPGVSIKMAREYWQKAKDLLAKGINPMDARKEERAQDQQRAREEEQTFKKTALEWYGEKMVGKSDGYRADVLQRLEKHVFPKIGWKPMAALDPRDVIFVLDPLGQYKDMQRRMLQIIGQVCRYALWKGYTTQDASYKLSENLPEAPPVVHRAALTEPDDVGKLLLAIDGYEGDISTQYALKILPYVFVRSQELRGARWPELNLEDAIWIIPAARMKMKKDHIVPLARQVVALFREMEPFRRRGDLVFPSPVSATKPISDMALLNALRIRLGYSKEEMTIHGFRAMARTMLHERLHFPPDVIEAQLAHQVHERLGEAYARMTFMEERKPMMQTWADYLDGLKEQAQRQLKKGA